MWIKILLGAVAGGAVLGAMGTSKINNLTSKARNRYNKVRPKKNRVAVVEVELEENQDVADLAFLVVKGVPKGTSVQGAGVVSDVKNGDEDHGFEY